jgi:hypothetical protein
MHASTSHVRQPICPQQLVSALLPGSLGSPEDSGHCLVTTLGTAHVPLWDADRLIQPEPLPRYCHGTCAKWADGWWVF